MTSKCFSQQQLQVVKRIGDIFIPGDGVMPKFSECGFTDHIDRMAAFLPPGDVALLGLLTNTLRFLPDCFIVMLVKLTLADRYFPGAIGSNLRKLDIGLRGIIFSLYYSFLEDKDDNSRRIQEGIRWDGAIRSKPEESDDLPGLIRAANPINE